MEEEILVDEQEEKEQQEELIEIVREKHSEKKRPERITDIFTIQLILTVLLVLVFAVINIFDSKLVAWFINEFKRRSTGETEQIIKDAVSYAVNIVK